MTKKKKIDSKRMAREIGEKIKKCIQDGNNIQEIPNIILEAMKSNGIELPDQIRQAITEYQQKK